MSDEIIIPIQVKALVRENENTTPKRLIRNIAEGEGSYIILTKSLQLPTKEDELAKFAPQGTTITPYNQVNDFLSSHIKDSIQGIQIHKQNKPIPEAERTSDHREANSFPLLLEAMKHIVDRNYETLNKNIISDHKSFAQLEELAKYLVKVDIVGSGLTDYSIKGPVANLKFYDRDEWCRTNSKKFGKGEEEFFVDVQAHLDRDFGDKNLNIYRVDFSTGIYLRQNRASYMAELMPVIHTIARYAVEQKIAHQFFASHDVEKIIRNEAPISLRTFGGEGNLDARLNDFVDKVNVIYKGLARAVEGVEQERQNQTKKIFQKYFAPEKEKK